MSNKRRRRIRVVIVTSCIVTGLFGIGPVLSRGQEPPRRGEDSGRAMAESAGCDMSQNNVVMNETIFDYHMYPGEPIGFATLEEAVLSMDRLAEGRDRAELSTATLRAAAAVAVAEGPDSNQFEVRLPGAALSVTRFHDGTYRATGFIECA